MRCRGLLGIRLRWCLPSLPQPVPSLPLVAIVMVPVQCRLRLGRFFALFAMCAHGICTSVVCKGKLMCLTGFVPTSDSIAEAKSYRV